MTLKEFAERYRVRIRRDGCDEITIPGKRFCPDVPERVEYRSHIYEHGDGRFGVCLLFLTLGRWTHAKKRLLADGFTLGQDGDTEGMLLFDPTNEKQARGAIREASIRYRKVLSEADRIARASRLNQFRAAKERQFSA
jgi:hypothetical protein